MRSKFIPLDQQRVRDCYLKLNYCRRVSRSLIYFQGHFHSLGTLDGWRRVMVDFWSSNEGYCQLPTASPDLLTMRYRSCVSDNNGYYWAGGGWGVGWGGCSLCNSHRSVHTNKTLVEIVAYFLCCSHFTNLFHQRRHCRRKVALCEQCCHAGIGQLFPNLCTEWRWMVNCNPRSLYSPWKELSTLIEQGAGWTPGGRLNFL